MTYVTLVNAMDWQATMALKAYRKRDYEAYRRHIRIRDALGAYTGHR
jgi:hypothetical protein